MARDFIEDIILPGEYTTRGSYTPAKKIDLGTSYLIFVSGIQPPQDDTHRVVTDDIAEQTKLVLMTSPESSVRQVPRSMMS